MTHAVDASLSAAPVTDLPRPILRTMRPAGRFVVSWMLIWAVVGCAVALANIAILEKEDLPGRVLRHEEAFLGELRTLLDLPIVGDVRGAGYFYGVELVKDKQTKARFETDECKRLFRDFLSPRLFELGLMCRVEDKQDPVIQLAPPLIAGPEEFAEIGRILRQALSEAWERMG